MKIDDPLDALTRPGIALACREAGLPLPESVSVAQARGRYAIYQLRFPAPSGAPSHTLWVELVSGVRGSALDLEHAALAVVEHTVDLPAGPAGLRIDDAALGCPAAIREARLGVPGNQWLAHEPEAWPQVAEVLGRTSSALAELPLRAFGTTARQGRFAPARGTWRGEWEAYLQALWRRARETGTDLGPLGLRALRSAEQGLCALEGVSGFTLVHGGLGPEAVERLPTGAVRVVGWGDALVGDAMVELGSLLALPRELLAGVITHVDPEVRASWRSEAAHERLRLYHLTWCLAQAAALGEYARREGSVERLAALERVAAWLRAALEPGFVENQLEGPTEPATAWRIASPEPEATLRRVLLATLASEPGPSPSQALALGAGLAGVVLAAIVQGAERRERCLTAAARLDLRARGPHADDAAIPDLAGWEAGLAELVVEAGHPIPLAVLWLGLDAIAGARGEVSAGTRRGLERLVRGSLTDASSTLGRTPPSPRVLGRSVLGLAALRGLARHVPGLATETRFAALCETLADVVPDLDPDPPPAVRDWPVEAAVAGLDTGDGPLGVLLVYALCELSGGPALPGGPEWVLAHAEL